MRAIILCAILAGCAIETPRPPAPDFPECPASIPIPAPLRKHETVGALEIRVEIAREDERARGDACAAAVDAMRAFLK